MAPPPSPAESTLSSDRAEPRQQALLLGADVATLARRTDATSRATSCSTRHTRRSATSSIAAEILGYSREMSGHLMNMMNMAQVQAQHDQSQNHVNQILAQNEMLRWDAKQRKENRRKENLAQAEVQRLDAEQREDSMRNKNLAREELFIRMKTEADMANQKREQDLMKMKTDADEATRKREQLFMEHELKIQKNAC